MSELDKPQNAADANAPQPDASAAPQAAEEGAAAGNAAQPAGGAGAGALRMEESGPSDAPAAEAEAAAQAAAPVANAPAANASAPDPFAQAAPAADAAQPAAAAGQPAVDPFAQPGATAAQPASPYGAPSYGQPAPADPFAANAGGSYWQGSIPSGTVFPQQPASPYGAAPNGWQQPADSQSYQAGWQGQPGMQPPASPYGQPAYGTAPGGPQPPKKKVWPWVLGGCLVALALFVLGTVGCVSCAVLASIEDEPSRSYDGYDYDYDYDYDDSYDHGYDYGYGGSSYYLTIDELQSAYALDRGSFADGRGGEGVYEVGVGKDIEPGLYFLQGSSDGESNYYLYDEEGKGLYELDDAVVYFGNYFVQLDEGDAFVFDAYGQDLAILSLDAAGFAPAAPYSSGLYRVGTDIPAGTYTVTVDEAAAGNASQESAAFVMKDLEFDDDSITETKYVALGGSQTVTVSDGDWLELFAASAEPAQP
ncbi:MAG TPA: hypothetical protein IAC12_06230 [Candidatus Aphodovivens avistercoris]|nr:hypothetical protein [Candidatus Aphodovivens avistercoris]